MSNLENKPKLMVVEDDVVNNRLIVGLLSGQFHIRTEDSAANAIWTLRDTSFKPDFILSDYMVPSVEDFNTFLAVLTELEFPLHSVFITSSYYEAIRDINRRLQESGIPSQFDEANFLKKPTDLTGLIKKFQRLAKNWTAAT